MSVISADDIISIIKNEIENYDWDNEAKETGEVIWGGDGIATVYGIDHAMYGEIVIFDIGVRGMVQDVRRDEVCCISGGGVIEEGLRCFAERLIFLCYEDKVCST